jgi:hypothetical protein
VIVPVLGYIFVLFALHSGLIVSTWQILEKVVVEGLNVTLK